MSVRDAGDSATIRALTDSEPCEFPRGLITVGETLDAPTDGHLECRLLAYFRPRPARRRMAPHLRLLFVPIAATLATATRATSFNCAERSSIVCGTAGLNAEQVPPVFSANRRNALRTTASFPS